MTNPLSDLNSFCSEFTEQMRQKKERAS